MFKAPLNRGFFHTIKKGRCPYDSTAKEICRILCSERQHRAIKAGYSEKYAKADACKILDNPSVAEYIRELSEKAQDERIMTAKERQALLSDIAKDGKNDPADRIRAVDTLNKMTGEYVAKIQAEVKTSEKLSDVFAQIGGEGLDE